MNYGVAVPFSTEGPTMFECQQSDSMEDFLYGSGAIYETPSGEKMRLAVIEKLRGIVRRWAYNLAESKELPPDSCADGGGIQLRIFGSTRLGVHNADSDIDILCLAPSFVSRSDFFNSFCTELSRTEGVESILSVPEAYTPVMKFTIDRQAVDMIFASLKMPVLPSSLDILDLRCLEGLDDSSVRCINGARVAEWICRLVPNLENFCSTLRVIKYWARQRGLYSNMLGFLGGVNYAILVAQVCQLYVCACPFTLVYKFFEVFSMWQWPNPVMLRSYEDFHLQDKDGHALQVWNARANHRDATHIMPIITPAYPAMNSAYNVSQPQFRVFQDEIRRACKIFQENATNRNFPWAELFQSSTKEFFQRHPRYVEIDIIATNAQDHRSWFGWVESRLRMLIVSLEQPPIMYSHPIANCFHRCQPLRLQEKSSAKSSRSNTEDLTTSSTVDEATNVNCCEKAENESIMITDNSKLDSTVDEKASLEPTSSSCASVDVKDHKHTDNTMCSDHSADNKPENKPDNIRKSDQEQEQEQVENRLEKGAEIAPSVQCRDLSSVPIVEDATSTLKPESTASDSVAKPLNSASAVMEKVIKPDEQNEKEEETAGVRFISSFMIGISFVKGAKYADLEPAITEFSSKVKGWTGRKDTMDLKVTVFDGRSPPKFITQTRAEPSNVKSCTPQPQRLATQVDDVSTVSTRLFPGSGRKAPLSRDISEAKLSAVMSNSNLGDNNQRRSLSREYPPRGPLFADSAPLSPRGLQANSPRSNQVGGRGGFHSTGSGGGGSAGWVSRQGGGVGKGNRSPIAPPWSHIGPHHGMPMNGMVLPPQFMHHNVSVPNSHNNTIYTSNHQNKGSPHSSGLKGNGAHNSHQIAQLPPAIDPRAFVPPSVRGPLNSTGVSEVNCSPASMDYYSPNSHISTTGGSASSVGSNGFAHSTQSMMMAGPGFDTSPLSHQQLPMQMQMQAQHLHQSGQYSSPRVMPFPALQTAPESASYPLVPQQALSPMYGQEQVQNGGMRLAAPPPPPMHTQSQHVQSPPKRYRKDLAGIGSSGIDSRGPYTSNGMSRRSDI